MSVTKPQKEILIFFPKNLKIDMVTYDRARVAMFDDSDDRVSRRIDGQAFLLEEL